MSKRQRAQFEESSTSASTQPFVHYGTPLAPLDSSTRDDGSYVPVWKQEVLDERGRKRLHGAFTGGFSAGYFNTVGSKEGWAPATFVSSRSARAKPQPTKLGGQSVEDFMDDEDLADRKEGQGLETSGDFAGLGTRGSDGAGLRDGVLDLFRPAETMGVRLLRRMGWKDGQGVGAKVWRRVRDDEGNLIGEGMHLFAPEDVGLVKLVKKNDSKGVGFEGETGLQSGFKESEAKEELDDGDWREPAKNKKTSQQSRKGAFGVGILNDTGSDDEDPYEMGPRISYNKTIGGEKAKKTKEKTKKKAMGIGTANPLLGANKPAFIPKKAATGFRKCHDGRLPLEGYVLASGPTSLVSSVVNQDGRYPPPEVPTDWKPSRQGATSNGQPSNGYQSVADAAKASSLDPRARADILGEAQLPGKSVFDFLSPSMRDRLASASKRADLPAGMGESAPQGFTRSEAEQARELADQIPTLTPEVAQKALGRGVGGWMPYAEDEEKRARYRTYLEVQAGLDTTDGMIKPSNVSKDDWIKELREFAHAAQMFKPMSGMMATRFTSSAKDSSSHTTDGDPETLLHQPGQKKAGDPAEEAAKAGMFGPMTRSVQQFLPTRLLCKRFNVKPPTHVESDPPAASAPAPAQADTSSNEPAPRFQSAGYQTNSKSLDLVSQANMDQMMLESGTSRPDPGVGEEKKTHRPPSKPVLDVERNEALEQERPDDAVFRAIFGSDDED